MASNGVMIAKLLIGTDVERRYRRHDFSEGIEEHFHRK
jgi:hypothetical protein